MSVLAEAGKILSTPQGSLVYYLLILWAVIAGLGMAWGEWRRARREQAQRLLIAMGGLVLVRVLYAIGALLATAGWISPTVLLPPLERFVDVVSLGLLAWAFVLPIRQRTQIWDWALGGNLFLALAACIGFAVAWASALAANPTLDYNTTWQAAVWSIWQIALIVLAGIAVVRSQREGWGTFLAAMIILFAGRLFQLFYPAVVLHLPAWERLSNLLAYPLIAVGVYQNIVAGLRVHSRQLQDISQASLDQIKSLLFLFETTQQMSGSLDISSVLDNGWAALPAPWRQISVPSPSEPGQGPRTSRSGRERA